ncbi:MAG: site-specific integrase [Candidatus Cybelea sp.]
MGYLKRVAAERYRYAYEGPRVNGRRQQITGTFRDLNKTEAEARLAKLEAEARGAECVRDPNLTFGDLLATFMEHKQKQIKEKRFAVSTYERYELYGKSYLTPAFGHVKVRDLRRGHLLDAYAKWSALGSAGKPLAGRSVRHLHDLTRAVLNFGIRRDVIARNVAALIPAEELPEAPKPEPVALNEAEVAQLLEAAQNPSLRALRCGGLTAEPWFAAAVAFAIYTGARRGEVLGVQWSDVDFESNRVAIRRSLARTQSRGLLFKEPKNGKPRTVALPKPLVTMLEEHRQRQETERGLLGKGYKDDGLVFARPDGSPVNPRSFGTRFIELAERAKVKPITLHCLRDTHASLLAKSHVPIDVISKRLGHADIRITSERYLHVYEERDAQAASTLDSLVGQHSPRG